MRFQRTKPQQFFTKEARLLLPASQAGCVPLLPVPQTGWGGADVSWFYNTMPSFHLQRISRMPGSAELVNLPLLIVCRYILAWGELYQMLQYVYFLVYLLEDLLLLGPTGYHLMPVSTKEGAFPADQG